jgi:hypothetical protein
MGGFSTFPPHPYHPGKIELKIIKRRVIRKATPTPIRNRANLRSSQLFPSHHLRIGSNSGYLSFNHFPISIDPLFLRFSTSIEEGFPPNYINSLPHSPLQKFLHLF